MLRTESEKAHESSLSSDISWYFSIVKRNFDTLAISCSDSPQTVQSSAFSSDYRHILLVFVDVLDIRDENKKKLLIKLSRHRNGCQSLTIMDISSVWNIFS